MGLCLALLASLIVPALATAQNPDQQRAAALALPTSPGPAAELLEQLAAIDGPVDFADIEPIDGLGPAPWTSFIPGRDPATVQAWVELARRVEASNPDGRDIPGVMPIYEELEPVNNPGLNDTPETGEVITGLGTGPGESFDTRVFGTLPLPPPAANCPSIEDDGSIDLATATVIGSFVNVDLCGGFIGDGPHADLTGDQDFFNLNYITEGSTIVADVGTFDPSAQLPLVTVAIYNSAGDLVGSGIDGGPDWLNLVLEIPAPADDRYYALIIGEGDLPNDPFDENEGPGPSTSGSYLAFMGAVPPPPCTYSEPNDSLATASPVDLSNITANCFGFVGDGEFGEDGTDVDFFVTSELAGGTDLFIDVFNEAAGDAAVVVAVHDAAGNVLGSLEDEAGVDALTVTLPETGQYYISVKGCCELPADPNVPGSGPASPVLGTYNAFVLVPPPIPGGEGEPPLPPPPGNRQSTPSLAYQQTWTSPAQARALIGYANEAADAGNDGFAQQDVEADPQAPCRQIEDNGSIATASAVDYSTTGRAFCNGEIGDGPYGDSSGDFDILALGEFSVDEFGIVSVAGIGPDATLTPAIDIIDSTGSIIAASGEVGPNQAEVVFFPFFDGPLWARIAATGSIQEDPTDSSSGSGVTQTGEYVTLLQRPANAGDGDVDHYLVDLEVGDVLRVALEGAQIAAVSQPNGELAQGSGGSASFIYPRISPLRHLGSTGAEHIAETAGLHSIAISQGGGAYEAELRVIRAGLTYSEGTEAQILFLDFDGATLDPSLYDPLTPSSQRSISPLSSFLAGWGLGPGDEDAVIDGIIAVVEEDYNEDLPITGGNGDRDSTRIPGQFDVEIKNSRDDGDLWGQPNVTRVIIGGTIDELGIPTIGIAQSIDPGNFDTEESTIVLLDLLSAPADDFGTPTLNQYPIAGGANKIDLVARGVGSVASHEAGHVLGNWHTETFNATLNIMDAGGDLAAIAGVGPDGVWGTPDDDDLDHVSDTFSPFEGFFGTENTAVRTAFALSTGQTAPDGEEPDDLEPGLYIIENVQRGRNLHADGTTNVDTSTLDNASSRWELIPSGDSWLLQNRSNNFYLDADGANENYNVELSQNPGNDDQWTITPTGDGAWLLQNNETNRYLDSDGGPDYNVDQSIDPSLDDEWIFRPVEDDGGGDGNLVGRVIILQSADNNRYLDADGVEEGYNADTSAGLSTENQWSVEDAGDGNVYLRNVGTGRYLDTDPDGSVDTSASASSDDRWEIVVLDGYYNLRSIDRNQYLDADGAGDDYDVNLSAVPAADDQWLITFADEVN